MMSASGRFRFLCDNDYVPMSDDPLTQTRAALQQARLAIQESPGNAAQLTEVLLALEMALDRLREAGSRSLQAERILAAQQALLDDRLLRMESHAVFTVWKALAASRRNGLQRVRNVLARSPLRGLAAHSSDLEGKAFRAAYAKWVTRQEAGLPSPEQARAVADAWTRQPTISLLLAVRRCRSLQETLESIRNQVYGHWQLCLVFDQARRPQVEPLVRDLESKYDLVYRVIADGLDEAGAWNAAAGLAGGEYLSFIGEAGTLSPFALYYVAEAVQGDLLDLIYADEDLLDTNSCRGDPSFKPDWSPDLLTSCMYMGQFVTVRREAFVRSGGLRSQYNGAHLHDLVLRLADGPARVHHLSRVLYHSRAAERTAPHGPGAASAGTAAARAIEDAIARREGIAARCVPGTGNLTFFVRRTPPAGDTTAIICSRSPKLVGNCLAALRRTADQAVSRVIVIAHEESGPNPALRKVIQQAGAAMLSFGGAFDFAAMNNLGARAAETSSLLFLNDDVEATSPGWAELLTEQVSREEVGVAGAVLWYPSRLLQHAGLVIGLADGIGHVGRYAPASDLWPWLQATRNVSAVTGACLAIRSGLFRRLGGFSAEFPGNYNDVDLCFRARERGLAVVCVPVPGLIHRECATRRGIVRFEERYRFYKRWASYLERPDPYYSPSLAPTERIQLNLEGDPGPRTLSASANFAGD
jgi:GT2 family glycosyltransferase